MNGLIHRGMLALVVLPACDMAPAETLSEPRILALRVDPAELVPGEAHTLTALTFAVSSTLVWSACPVAWQPTSPVSCPTGDALALGTGNPLTTVLPADQTTLWLRAETSDSSALPAVKRIDVGSGAVNPDVRGVQTDTGPLPTTLTGGDALTIMTDLGSATDPRAVVVSWYVTAGRLEPARTLGDATSTLTTDAPGPLGIIAVVRDAKGGTGWTEAQLEVVP